VRILLVEPEFPVPAKSKNHSNFLPIGLLKLAAFYRNQGHEIQLNRGNIDSPFTPEKILVTSLFTYWANYVKETVMFYKSRYPDAEIIVGGIYATLMPEDCKEVTGCDNVFIGQHQEADRMKPAYDLVDVDYQILHGMRGCTRKCPFCGIWKLEKLSFKDQNQLQEEIFLNKLVFYDNNFLVNPHIENILTMLSDLRINKKVVHCECQSGFDGREIEKRPYLAKMLKNARFKNVRLAWDFSYEQYEQVAKWIEILENAGYRRCNIFIFMIFNWSFDFKELEQKRNKCFEWGVQISDCRYRPLNQTFDNYDSRQKGQTSSDYYIHSNWTDLQVRQFRKNVRIHNICIRHRLKFNEYSRDREKGKQSLTETTIIPSFEMIN
jgi:hypothetical protein